MSYQQITDLLEKYFDGSTSLDEERVLKNYFNSSLVDERLANYRPLFAYFQQQKAVQLPENQGVKLRAVRGGRRWIWQTVAAAAMVAAFATGGWLYQKNMAEERARLAFEALHNDTFEDPERAMKEIKAALALVSRKMNKGQKEASKGLKKVKTLDVFIKQPN